MSNLADCWDAETSDGRHWHEHLPTLRVEPHSPWRELEALCRREGLSVVWAQVHLPAGYMRLDAEGCPLVCGELLTQETSLTGGGGGSKRYRWVRREEATRWVWGIVGVDGAWQYETPPGTQACPVPPT